MEHTKQCKKCNYTEREAHVTNGGRCICGYEEFNCDHPDFFCHKLDDEYHVVQCVSCDYNYTEKHTFAGDRCSECGAEKTDIIRKIGNLYYTLKVDNTASVSVHRDDSPRDEWQASDMTGSVTIPASVTYDGVSYTVTSVARDAFWGCDVEEVVLPDTITEIDVNAFSNCQKLTKITLSQNLQKIREGAFGIVPSLSYIFIPASVTQIERGAFWEFLNIVICCQAYEKPQGFEEGWCTEEIPYQSEHAIVMWNVKEIGSFEDYDYAVLNNNTVSVFKYKGEDKNVVVPAVIADLRVTEIAERAFCGNLVERITLSDGIVTIGKQAFEGVVNFLSIDIPASVQQLGEAFVNGGVAYFEAAETEVVLPDENIQYTTKMVYNSGTEAVPIDGLRYSLNSSDHTAQLNVTISRELVDVVIPREVEHAGVTYTVVGIKDEALWYTYADIHNSNESTLNSVYIPETVVNFGTDIFLDTSPNGTVLYCKGEISAENADKIYGMGIVSNENAVSNAVYDTESQLWYSITDGKAVVARQGKNVAETVTIPATITANGTTYNVTEIGSAAFYGRNGVKEVTVGANVTVIGAFSFDYCKGLGAVKFANGSMLETIQNEAFNACTALKTVQIPASVTEIFHLAFQDCNALQGVYVDSLAAWCGISFYDDKANPLLRAHNLYVNDTLVEVLEIPASVTEIKSYAFNGFGGTSLRLHDNVTSIGKNAFYNCSVLSSVTIPASVQSMGEYAFNNCPLLILYCQSESRPSGWNVGFNNFEGGKVVWNCDSNNAATDGTIYLETNGVRYRVINNEAQVMLQHRFVSGDVTILDQVSYDGTTYPVTSIVENAFDNCADVTSVTIGRNVATIYSYAFRNCTGLISVTLSDNSALENIASYAFYGCSKLTTVTFAENGSLETIGSYAFSRCYALSALELPATLKTISNYAFSECRSLLTVSIRQDDQTPSALKTIGGDAFNGCPSLVTFTIPASVTSVGSFVFSNSLALTVYCETTKGNAATMWNSNWGASSLENSGFAVVWSCKYNTVAENGYEYMYGDGLRFAIKDGVAVVAVQPRNVTSVTIPAYIRYRNTDYAVVGIADYAFSECKDLTEVTFNTDDNFTRIGNYAFRGCENLASITVPDSVTDMGRSVFYGCPLLTA